MKIMKLALLGGAALAVTAIGAQADELTDLKAQLEALNSRVAQLETAPQVPAGYNLMTISEGQATVIPGRDRKLDTGYGDTATVISILPTADAAPAASIEWSGYARAILGYTHDDDPNDHDDWEVNIRGQLKVVGKTDTAVGEVGAILQLRSEAFTHDVKAEWTANEAFGWWDFAPGLSLQGGFTGSLGQVGYGLDGACTCYYTDNGDGADLNPGDAEQLRFIYESGPIIFGVSVEDSDSEGGAFAADFKWSGDSFAFLIAGFYDYKSGVPAGDPDDAVYQIGAGTSIGLGDMAALSIGVAYGQDNFVVADNQYWAVSALASIDLSDAIYAELGYAYKDRDETSNSQDAIAGLYYQPVDQLTLGIEGEWLEQAGLADGDDDWRANFVSVFRF